MYQSRLITDQWTEEERLWLTALATQTWPVECEKHNEDRCKVDKVHLAIILTEYKLSYKIAGPYT